MALTAKQAAFVDEFLIDMNRTQAAIRAGYSPRTAEQAGARLFRKVEVAAAITKAKDARASRIEITQDRVVEGLGRLGFSDIRKLYDSDGTLKPIHELDDDTAAAVSEVTVSSTGRVRVKLHDKQPALVTLGKHLGMFTERLEVKLGLEELVMKSIKLREERTQASLAEGEARRLDHQTIEGARS